MLEFDLLKLQSKETLIYTEFKTYKHKPKLPYFKNEWPFMFCKPRIDLAKPYKGFILAGGCMYKKHDDIDIFIYEDHMNTLNYLLEHYKDFRMTRTKYVINLEKDILKIQIVLSEYKSIAEILYGFDLGCSQIGYDGVDVYATVLGKFTIETGYNIVDVTKSSSTFTNRLYRYIDKGVSHIFPFAKRGARYFPYKYNNPCLASSYAYVGDEDNQNIFYYFNRDENFLVCNEVLKVKSYKETLEEWKRHTGFWLGLPGYSDYLIYDEYKDFIRRCFGEDLEVAHKQILEHLQKRQVMKLPTPPIAFVGSKNIFKVDYTNKTWYGDIYQPIWSVDFEFFKDLHPLYEALKANLCGDVAHLIMELYTILLK